MSAIVGIYYRDGRQVAESTVAEMLKQLAHRGADGSNAWCGGAVGLGQVMLWTTPESLNERLPLVDPASNLVLTADARIDNRDELLPELYGSKFDGSSVSDSELILAGYQKWGTGCAEKFVGDFAFAIWDPRNQRVYCGRDHFGLKPFHYFLSDKMFVFATEIKALLCVPGVPRRLNELKVADFLAGIDEDKEITPYQQILRLPPAHSLEVSKNAHRLNKYWSLDPSYELRLSSNEEYADAFREQFTEAVRCRLRSAFPVGSMLSGGLDSSSITCVARNLNVASDQPLRTFSAIYDNAKQVDERPYIKTVLAQNGVKPNYVRADESTPLAGFKDVSWNQDDFITSGNHFIQRELCRAAAGQGVRVVLDGYDGDTTVSHGTGYLIELARAGRWLKLGREARGYTKHFDNVTASEVFWWYMRRYWLDPNMPEAFKPAWRKLRAIPQRLHSRSGPRRLTEFPPMINRDFAQRIGLEDRRQDMKKVRRSDGPLKTERQAHYSRLTWALMTGALESLNKVGGAFGVEYRFPFFDKRLAEFCLSLPPEQKLNRGWNRVVMRRALEGILPKEVQWRGGKGDLSANFDRGMRAESDQIEDLLFTNSAAIEHYVDIGSVRAAYQRFRDDQAGESDVMTVWRSVSLALWLRATVLKP
jgi:asparagine synthase (glutamine-hydrolysing)